MADRRDAEDSRWQRLANLSIEIRMLKARVQAAFDEDDKDASAGPGPDANVAAVRRDASCPYCGHTAGLARLPREYRRQSTPVRCFACQRDSAAVTWTAQPATALDDARNTRSPR